MNRRRYLGLLGATASAALAGCAGTDSTPSTAGSETDGTDDTEAADPTATATPAEAVSTVVEPVATGFANPWGLAVLPDESAMLVTERPGRLSLVDLESGERTELGGAPEVFAQGQGGLLDVELAPDFGSSRQVYLTYAVGDGSGRSTTRLGRGRLDRGAGRLADLEALYTAQPFVESAGHFGSRVVFDPDGFAYVSVGDRQFKDFGPDHVAQRLDDDLGSVLRLEPDGSIPDSNPFVGSDASDAVFTYGNRNPQGLTVHPETGAVWESEFGERDGDEINVLEAGANYGWPVADNSCRYGTDDPVGVRHDERSDVVAPVYGWPCGSGGFPPAGMTFYDGSAFPDWQGDLFVSGLAKQYLARFTVDGREVTEREPLLADRDWRIRDVTVGPVSGHLYVAVDAGDAPVVRVRPE
jgi:quinoprotein glucose dehydrogenase